MTAPITRFKKDLLRVLKTILPNEFVYKDSEESVDKTKTPGASISTDAGTKYSKAEYGLIQGKTTVKIDIYLSMGKIFKNNSETDQVQEQIRQAVLSDPAIQKNYSLVEFTDTAAVSLPGENSLRVLTHDLELTWTEAQPEPESFSAPDLHANGEPLV
jgi:hypothetical protein